MSLSSSVVYRMITAAKCSQMKRVRAKTSFFILNVQNVLLVVIVFHWYTLNKQRTRRIYFRPVYVSSPMLNKKKRDHYCKTLIFDAILSFCHCVFLNSLELRFIWVALLAWGAGSSCLIYFCTFLFKGVWNYMMCLCLFFFLCFSEML